MANLTHGKSSYHFDTMARFHLHLFSGCLFPIGSPSPVEINHFIVSCHDVCILQKTEGVGGTSQDHFGLTCPHRVSSGHKDERNLDHESHCRFQPQTRNLSGV